MKKHLSFVLSVCALVILSGLCDSASGQIINTIAGTGAPGFSGDGGPATAAQLNRPFNLVADNAGNVLIADHINNRVRKISPAGIITTIAGISLGGFSGDGGPATAAKLSQPTAVAIDHIGNIFICDYANNKIRKVDTFGIITTLAGIGGTAAYSGDGGPATAAQLSLPYGVTTQPDGSVYITDHGNNRVRKVSTSGIITTVAGNGTYASAGDGGPATAASLKNPIGIAFDPSGNMYISETPNYTVRKVTPSGIISTVAGVGSIGSTGDGGPASAAYLGSPWGLSADNLGNVYIADRGASKVRKIDAAGNIYGIAGNGALAFGGDGGPATAAQLFALTGVYASPDGSKVYIADIENNRIRMVSCPLPPITGVTATACEGATITLSHTSTGGKWHSSDTSLATIDSVTGVLALIDSGVVTISYSDTTNCGLSTVNTTVSVDALPYAGIISGTDSACPGYTVTLSGSVAGGTWISKHPPVATISGTGLVSAIATGIDTIIYIVSNLCGSDTASFIFRTRDIEKCIAEHAGTEHIEKQGMLVNVFPNPFDNTLAIRVEAATTTKCSIYICDMAGRAVFCETGMQTNSEVLLAPTIPPGMYILEVRSETATERMKLIKR